MTYSGAYLHHYPVQVLLHKFLLIWLS